MDIDNVEGLHLNEEHKLKMLRVRAPMIMPTMLHPESILVVKVQTAHKGTECLNCHTKGHGMWRSQICMEYDKYLEQCGTFYMCIVITNGVIKNTYSGVTDLIVEQTVQKAPEMSY